MFDVNVYSQTGNEPSTEAAKNNLIVLLSSRSQCCTTQSYIWPWKVKIFVQIFSALKHATQTNTVIYRLFTLVANFGLLFLDIILSLLTLHYVIFTFFVVVCFIFQEPDRKFPLWSIRYTHLFKSINRFLDIYAISVLATTSCPRKGSS